VWHNLLDKPRTVQANGRLQRGSLLGPRYESKEIKSFLAGEHRLRGVDDEASADRVAN
jgi:hypothetical protein